MFTGLIEEIGEIKSIHRIGDGRRITVKATKIMDDLKIDDSVAINGACQTVVSLTSGSFDVETVEETILKTTLGEFFPGKRVNLERAAKLGDRMGGHLVQGHVDCTGSITLIEKLAAAYQLWIGYPNEFNKYIVAEGSVCIDGISLTTARDETGRFMVSIIPHTWKMTTLSELKTSDKVNLEFDIIGKYIEKISLPYLSGSKTEKKTSGLDKYIDQPMF